jgi:hypothetical protein
MEHIFHGTSSIFKWAYTNVFSSIKNFKGIIRMNCIKGNPVTTEDIDIAQAIFGPDIGVIKGKTTPHRPTPVVADYVDIPEEILDCQQNITLCIDTMYVNKLAFFTTVSCNIRYRTATWLDQDNVSGYRSALEDILHVYKEGFRVTTIRCDNEFKGLKQFLRETWQITMNVANAQEHVPEIERSHRVIMERARAMFHRLPYQALPKLALKILVLESAKKFNFFPPKGGISSTISPRVILHKVNLDYNKHCAIPLGSYVQALDDPPPAKKITLAPRAIDGIYLRYQDSSQGGHQILDLRTQQVITRQKVQIIPVTSSVVQLVHDIAKQDRMPEGLKIATKTGTILYDSTLIAGVD